MAAVRAHQGSPDPHLDVVPIPEVGPDDVLIKVTAAGISPGMLRVLALGRLRHLPTTLGAEAAGTIADVGSNVERFAVGDRVRLHPSLNCGRCGYCRTNRDMMCPQQAIMGHGAFGDGPLPLYRRYHDGALAEFVRAPYWQVDHLPDSIDFGVGAKINHFATAARALKSGDVRPGSTIIVTAPTGSVGAATAKIAKAFGVARLILVGRQRERLDAVAALGGVATEVVATNDLGADWPTTEALTAALHALLPDGADAILDYTPQGPTVAQCLPALATGGTLVHLGANDAVLPIALQDIMINCWRTVGIRGNTRTDAREMLALLGSGAVNGEALITHRYPLVETLQAFRDVRSRDTATPMWMVVATPGVHSSSDHRPGGLA
jgi:threonine dehydrogenase-like Zn-dependent dehydrogenase